MGSLMRAIRDAAAAHARNAERAHEKAVANPKLARRDVEMALRAEETTLAAGRRGGGGLKQSRRLRVAADGSVPGGLTARPPKKGGRRSRPRANADGSYAGPLGGEMPTLQPMPRFVGAGPVHNHTLLSSRQIDDADMDRYGTV